MNSDFTLKNIFTKTWSMHIALAITFLLLLAPTSNSEVVNFNDSWGNAGFNLVSQDASGVEVIFSIEELYFGELELEGATYSTVGVPGIFLPNDAGAPNLPGDSRFIAVPKGASVRFEVLESKTVTYQNMDIAPAPVIQWENDDTPPVYEKAAGIYTSNVYYPELSVLLSELTDIRGVDVVQLGITPFRYNPVTKELVVIRDIKVKVDFIGGTGHFGEDRLRNRHWEPVYLNNLLNYESLPEIDFTYHPTFSDDENVEYLIICPEDPDFIAWADTLKNWRNQQGISAGVTTLGEIGGNNVTAIQMYILNAYFTWDVPPVAVLLLSDYQNSGDTYGITSPIYNNYCASDNIYTDMSGNHLPDLAIARITAQDANDLETMIGKILDYERNPPEYQGFYDNPLFAGGWQTERWFILCTEVVRGYFETVKGLDPPREYAIYEGTPGTIWSSNNNTYQIVNYFGPNGLGYIPNTPEHLTDWSGNASGINTQLNDGSFFMLHRDHGYESGWGEPDYSISSLSGLNNQYLPFVFSINCLTGKFNNPSQCFTEVFHRMNRGALGLTAASEVSYSFVNDTYVWGMFDSMWSDFMPGYGNQFNGYNTLRPCFANINGKYFLQQSSWPYNTGNKIVTYHLFHHHGDAFTQMYTEMPQELSVSFQPVLFAGDEEFMVTANAGALAALTVDGQIIGVAEANGSPVAIPIEPQMPGSTMLITVTLQNYYRYEQAINVVPDQDVYVIYYSHELNDATGNGNGLLDIGETAGLSITIKNIGANIAQNVNVSIASDDEYITILDENEFYGNIDPDSTSIVEDGFEIEASGTMPDMHEIEFNLTATDGDLTWESYFDIIGHAPAATVQQIEVIEVSGNNNGQFDPGETADFNITIRNEGSCGAENMEVSIETDDPLITITNSTFTVGALASGASAVVEFDGIESHPSIIQGSEIPFTLTYTGDGGYFAEEMITITIGDESFLASGPDEYGYYAYDMYDGLLAPEYDWMEIAPLAGGSGTDLGLNTNNTIQMDIPFTFQHYGEDFDRISICSNGWMCFGETTTIIMANLMIPHTLEANSMAAAFWDALTMDAQSQVCYYNDVSNSRFIIEWYNVPHLGYPNDRETFQVIIHDPSVYQTLTGDGEIIVNYHTVSQSSQYFTAGIENGDGTVGLQYVYNNTYAPYAVNIESSFAVKYTTAFYVDPNMPLPFTLISPANEDTNWIPDVNLVWHTTTDPNPGIVPGYDVWIDTLSEMSTKWMVGHELADTTLDLNNLMEDYTYYWNVRATDTNSPGKWAEEQFSFLLFYPEPLQDFTLLSPENGASITSGETVFLWEAAVDPDPGDAVEYELCFSDGVNSISFSASVESLAVDLDSTGVLGYGEDSEWYVTAHSSFPDMTVESLERFGFTPLSTGPSDDLTGIPDDFCIFQNYPNPFNPTTMVRFGVPKAAPVKISVYDILGRQTAILADKVYQPGYHIVKWDADGISSGIYFIRMESPGFKKTMKMLLLH